MATEPHIHEYAVMSRIAEDGPIIDAFCVQPECDHELDAEGIILGLNASACINQEQAEEIEQVVTAEANASGSEYLSHFDMAYRLRRYAASLTPVVVADAVS